MSEPVWGIICALAAAIFTWGTVAKLVRYRTWMVVLANYRLPPALELAARPGVPALEAAAAVLLLTGRSAPGALLALVLLTTFSFAVVRAQAAAGGNRLPCGCMGTAREHDYRLLLIRNLLLAAGTGSLLLAPHAVRPFAGIELPAGSELLPFALVAGALGLALWLGYQARVLFVQRETQ